MMYEMKGVGETVMVGELAARGRIELVRFADGSWAIRQGETMMGVWERHERGECLRVFNMLAGVGAPRGRWVDAFDGGGPEGAWN
jgi:hypothetical protein